MWNASLSTAKCDGQRATPLSLFGSRLTAVSDLFEKVRAALAERKVTLDCPSCGEREWKVGAGELGNLWGLLPLVTEHGESIDVEGQRGGLPVAPMICSNCGYMRLYALRVLLGDDWEGLGRG